MAATSPYGCTCLLSLQMCLPTNAHFALATGSSTIQVVPIPQLLDSIFRNHIWQLHHKGASASSFGIGDTFAMQHAHEYHAPQTVQKGSGDLQEGHPSVTKGASPSAKHPSKVLFTKTWRGLHLRKASRGLHLRKGGLKGTWKGLQRGLKGASRGLQGGLKGASRGLHLRKALRRLQGGLKGPTRGLQGGFKRAWRGLEAFRRWRGLRKAWRGLEGGWKSFEGEGGFEGAWRGLEGGFKGACRDFTFGKLWRGLKEASTGKEASRRLEAFSAEEGFEEGLKRASSSEGLKGAWYAMDCFSTYFTHAQT